MDDEEKLNFFAGCALVGLLSSGKVTDQSREEVVESAFHFADQMLQEDKKWNPRKQ